MALDEALLRSAESSGTPWLRFYQWEAPTLSLGYFQLHADRRLHSPSSACPLVRRASGGGAILHDHELTYSLALPASHSAAKRPETLYDAAHNTLVEALHSWHIAARLHSTAPPPSRSGRAAEPFLCFQRQSSGDVLLGDSKICGSAQRRRGGAVLQHGSILLERSHCAPELPGLRELAASSPRHPDELLEVWQPILTRQLGFTLQRTSPPESVAVDAELIRQQKFGSETWNRRR